MKKPRMIETFGSRSLTLPSGKTGWAAWVDPGQVVEGMVLCWQIDGKGDTQEEAIAALVQNLRQLAEECMHAADELEGKGHGTDTT